MDAYLDSTNMSAVQSWYRNAFTAHYNGQRQPFGLYQHPIHLATGYPGVEDPIDERNMIVEFLDWAQAQQNVWIVTNQQLIAWMRNPVPVSRLNEIEEFGCQVPKVDAAICNGMYPNSVGLIQTCPFPDVSSYSCTFDVRGAAEGCSVCSSRGRLATAAQSSRPRPPIPFLNKLHPPPAQAFASTCLRTAQRPSGIPSRASAYAPIRPANSQTRRNPSGRMEQT